MDSDAPIYSPLFGVLGVVSGIVFSCFGAAYGTARSGQAISALGVIRPELMTQSIIPVIMAGILAIYGLVVSAVIANSIKPPPDYKLSQGFLHLGAGLSVGLSCLASGVAIGTVGDSGVRALSANPKIFVSMVLILIFCEVLGLYGMILSLMLISRTN